MRKIFTFFAGVLLINLSLSATTPNFLSFTGGSSDYTAASTVDESGNVYLVGSSSGSWGTPLNSTGGVFVAKYNNTGNLVWNTFLGGTVYDTGSSIALDASGNIYVLGSSSDSWGVNIKRAFVGAYVSNVFVAKLNSSGALQWNTFLGGETYQTASALCLDRNGNIYVTGSAQSAWAETPIRAYSTGSDAFVAKLNETGIMSWYTFLGGTGSEYGNSIALDSSDSIVVTGNCNGEWTEDPKNTWTNDYDGYVTKIGNNGGFGWYTFIGGTGSDSPTSVKLDANNNIYISGYSNATWGTPVSAYTASTSSSATNDGFVAKLSKGGSLVWNTFFGSDVADMLYSVGLDADNNVFAAGASRGTWGTPVNAYTASTTSSLTYDATAIKLNNSGTLVWNTFLGSANNERAYGINPTTNGIYLGGYAAGNWASPVIPYTSGTEGFAARLKLTGELDSNTLSDIKRATSKDISIYPTTTSTEFTISGLEQGEAKIYDMSGRLVLSNNISGNTRVKVSSLKNGVYTIRIANANANMVTKLIKK